MEFKPTYNSKTNHPAFGPAPSINDIRDKEFSGAELSENEKKALVNFDHFRIRVLDEQKTEQEFHQKYLQLQVMANLAPFEEFLNDKYFGK